LIELLNKTTKVKKKKEHKGVEALYSIRNACKQGERSKSLAPRNPPERERNGGASSEGGGATLSHPVGHPWTQLSRQAEQREEGRSRLREGQKNRGVAGCALRIGKEKERGIERV